MAFEFFFGVFGLLSSDPKTRHKSRLEGDWRHFVPLGASLFEEKGPLSAGSPTSFNGPQDPNGQRPIFSTSGSNLASNSVNEGLFSSVSSSSTSSITSSGSTSTINSTTGLIKGEASLGGLLDPSTGKKYEYDPSKNGSTANLLGDQTKADETEDVSADDAAANAPKPSRLRVYYCRIVCLILFLHVGRLLVGLTVEESLLILDFCQLGAFRSNFLIPTLCLAIQVAAVTFIFIRNNEETNWLVPFYSSKDYLIRSRSNFRPKIEDYSRRVTISIALALLLALASSVSLSAYLIHSVMESEPMRYMDDPSMNIERIVLAALLVFDVIWAIYSAYICFLVCFYFNLICSIMRSRFHGISKIIEDLAESNTSKTTNQARKITTLYLEHNEACELLDESNDFWQYLIFFTYFTYIPAYCYCLYNLFFVDFESWQSFVTWVIHTHAGFIILLVSFSAAGVSTEAHAPYTSLHTLSLIQLPLDVEVNIATFLHRVRGLIIGYSCYDLFAITNASMSNTAAACASYFLIVADFSRSSVFSQSQMNGTAARNASLAALAGGGGGGGVVGNAIGQPLAS